MSNNQQNIDRIIREKFENFAPAPPDFIWDNIEANLNGKTSVFGSAKVKSIVIFAVSAIVIILLGWLLLGNKYFSHKTLLTKSVVSAEKPVTSKNNVYNTAKNNNTAGNAATNGETAIKVSKNETTGDVEVAGNDNPTVNSGFEKSGEATLPQNNGNAGFNYTAAKDFEFKVNDKENESKFVPTLGALLYSDFKISMPGLPHLLSPAESNLNKSTGNYNNAVSKWKAGLFISPEFAVTSLDSLEVLHSYTLGVDMQYSLSKNSFLRFGLGTTYARDRGLTAIEFKSWDYIGSYDDVYEVTFDTSSGVPVPIYHTQKVDVYDSIRHFDVSETVNKYLYLQFPVLLGYNIKTKGKFNWYVYGGPVINALVYKEKSTPQLDGNGSLLSYDTGLYERNNLVYQFWLGMGFEFDLTDKFGFTFEPNYRYYFNPVFKNYYEKQPLSAVSLRLGLFIKL